MSTIMRRIFRLVNKFFMVPVFRLGLGPFFGNPLTGYIMVLKAIGRKTGRVRCAPVNYAILEGQVYCISAGRNTSDWYRNLMANPEIEILLPAGPVFGRVVEVVDQSERLIAIRQVLKNAGFAGFFEGYNPYKVSDTELAEKTGDLPVLRFKPAGLANGASDPG
jgi:deazaflavin-dependent oxidoreductase (nitroreductase family)